MYNLFILHTQYNIILSSGIVLEKLKGYRNDIIVYAEFKVSDKHKEQLSKIFDKVIYIREQFAPLPIGFVNEEKQLVKEYALYSNSDLFNVKYDNVFLSQERDLDCLILGHCKKKNPNIKIHDIEEDCYYSLNEKLNDINWHERVSLRESIKRALKSIYRYFRFGVPGYCHYGKKFYGGAKFFDYHHVIYPVLVRKEIKSKIENITSEMIINGCNALYGLEQTTMPLCDKYYLFFFDLLERYKDKEEIKMLVDKIIMNNAKNNSVILLKYHPRETQKFDYKGGNTYEIASNIPAEKLLADLNGKNVTVIGNATTAVIVANKLGFRTYSVAKACGIRSEQMISQMINMGIIMPENIESLMQQL